MKYKDGYSFNLPNMKKIKIAFLLIFISSVSFGQSIELIPYSGYMFGGKIHYYDGNVNIKDSENYGVALNYILENGIGISLEYIRQPTSFVHTIYRGGFVDRKITGDLNNDWFQLGAIKHFGEGKVVPYGGLGLGVASFAPQKSSYDDEVKFAITAQGGVKFFFNDHLGIKLHLRMLVPIQWSGFGFYGGSGGSGGSVNLGSSFVQGDVGGGLVFRF
ncbi:hypothetical protein E9993_14400 [Labilibacter sediminis]|nr:hypothetical protein E9993_14400 [Labilibacter sediminis]